MNDDLMRQVGTIQTTIDNLKKPELSRNPVTPFASLPGLIGLWYGGNYRRSTGDMPNLAPYISGASSQDLSINGTRTNYSYDYLTNGVGYINFPGSAGHYYSVADNTDLDIQGNEGGVANPGLTILYWARVDAAPAANEGILAKDDLGANRSFLSFITATNTLTGQITTDGSTVINSGGTVAVTNNVWFFGGLRFIPSTSLSAFLNGVEYANTVGIPATIYSGNATLYLGAIGGAIPFDGDISICSLHTCALSDATIQSIFQQTRSLYGV